MDNCMDPGFQESLLSAFWFVNSALPVKFECVRSKISQFCCAVPLLHTSCVPGTSAPLMFACVFLCGLRPPRLHGESPRTTGPVVVRLAERANERERERTGPVYPRSWSGRRPGRVRWGRPLLSRPRGAFGSGHRGCGS